MRQTPKDYMESRPELRRYIYAILSGKVITDDPDDLSRVWWEELMMFTYGRNRMLTYPPMNGKLKSVHPILYERDMAVQRSLIRYAITMYLNVQLEPYSRFNMDVIREDYNLFAKDISIEVIPKEVVLEVLLQKNKNESHYNHYRY